MSLRGVAVTTKTTTTAETAKAVKTVTSCFHCSLEDVALLTKGKQVSLVSIHFPHSESDGKSSDVGVRGRIGIVLKCNEFPQKMFFAFAFVLILFGTEDLSHACPHRYFTPNFTFAFAFLILKVPWSTKLLRKIIAWE